MRVAPAPLYNTAEDVRVFVATLAAVLDEPEEPQGAGKGAH